MNVFGLASAEACCAKGRDVAGEDLLRGRESWVGVLGAVKESDELVFDGFRGGTGDLLPADAGDEAVERVDHFSEARR